MSYSKIETSIMGMQAFNLNMEITSLKKVLISWPEMVIFGSSFFSNEENGY